MIMMNYHYKLSLVINTIMVLITLCALGSFLPFKQPVENSAIMIMIIAIEAFIITPYPWAHGALLENLLTGPFKILSF